MDEEHRSCPGKYDELEVPFFVDKDDNVGIGCIGLRIIQTGICKMKKLYVKEEYKRRGLGRELIKVVIEKAKKKEFLKMRPEKLHKMKASPKKYKKLRFYETEQYVFKPMEGAVFMEEILFQQN